MRSLRSTTTTRPGWPHLAALFVALALALPGSAGAQINTEKLRIGSPDPGFHGWVDGRVLLKTGNVDLLQIGAGARLEYNHDVHQVYLQGDYTFAQKGGLDLNDSSLRYLHSGFGHLRWTAMWHERIGTEIFGQAQFNEFLRLQLRALGGAGIRVPIVAETDVELIFGTGYMAEYEDLDIDASNSHPEEVLNHRWTNYLTLRVTIQPWLRLAATTYYQPRFDAFTDFRVLQDVALEVDVVEHLAIVIGFSLLHDHDPPDGVEQTDITFQPALRVSW